MLVCLFFLAAAVTWSLSGGAVARSETQLDTLFQSQQATPTSQPDEDTATPDTAASPTSTPSATATTGPTTPLSPTPSATAKTTAQVRPGVTITASAVLTPVPTTPSELATPLATEPLEPTTAPVPSAPPSQPTAAGFLPPPTLTSPDTPTPGPSPALQPAVETPLAARTAIPQEGPPRGPGALLPVLAGWVNSGLVAVSYAWLFCGVLFLAGLVLGLAWLARRNRRS